MINVDTLAAGLVSAAPFARTLSVRFVSASDDGTRVVLQLPDLPVVHSQRGGTDAGALFALGETAASVVVMATFSDQLTRATPSVVRAGIEYHRLTLGPALATATLARPPAAIVAELDAARRPEFEVDVAIAGDDGTVNATMVLVWGLRPRRANPRT